MKNLTTSFARAAMLLLLAVFTTTTAQAQSSDPIVTGYYPLAGTQGHKSSENFPSLVDGNKSTKWCVTGFTVSASNPIYIEFYSTEVFIPTGYVMTTGNDAELSPQRNPQSWVIKAKLNINDASWTTIATVTNDNVLQDVNTTDYEFTLTNSTAYKYFRIEVTAVEGGSTHTFQLSEFQFRGHPEVVGPVTTDLSTITSNYTAQNGEVLTGTLDTENHPVKISIADGATVTLRNATIIGVDNNDYRWAGITCLGDATIVLESGTTNTVKGFRQYYPGIFVPQNKTLTIKGSGTLNASSYYYGAGIGGGSGINCGNIVIEGGTINASTISHAAAIGGGATSSCGSITITGGTVTADGETGIGAGMRGSCENITISGGTVTATGGSGGAGIGSGDIVSSGSSSCGTITISGGTVTATGGYNAAGIGSGNGSICGNITISNSVTSVTATRGSNAPNSIGAGTSGTCGAITIDDVVTGDIAKSSVTYKPSVNYKYTIQFNSNGGSGTMADQQFLNGFAQNLSANTFTYSESYNFLGWSTTANGEVAYTDGQSVSGIAGATANATVTLFAQWNHIVDLSTLTSNYRLSNGEVVTGELGGDYIIFIADGATVTLSDVTIDRNSNNYHAGLACDGDATIILADGTTNTVKGLREGFPGIFVPEGKTLTIKGDGELIASSNGLAPGIGSCFLGSDLNCGNICIEGGIITATGGQGAAGIGSANGGTCGDISISGGSVTATGGYQAACIGSGDWGGTCGNITISGGRVEVTADSYGAGIGSGLAGICGDISISGGTITAKGGNYAPGIGSGCSSKEDQLSTCGNITISGGTVTATGGTGTAGIGSGFKNSSCQDITITNGVQSVTATCGQYATISIGKGLDENSTCGTVTIDGTIYPNGITESPYIYVPVRDIVLPDGTAYTYVEDYPVTTATYKRTIEESRVGKHQSWLLPFDYAITADDLEKFSFYKINMIANSPSQSQDATDQMWLFLTKLGTVGTVLHANMPYVIKAKEVVTNYAFTSSNVTLKAKNTDVILKTETAEDVYSFYATYEDTPASGSDQFYYVSSLGNICLGTSVTIGPYRWIIRKTNKFGNTTSYAREMHFFDGEEDDATGLNEFDNFTNSQSDDCWYDLSGRIVKSSNSPSVKLPRGIYIHGGRKEAIR